MDKIIKLPLTTYRAEKVKNMDCYHVYRVKVTGKDTKVLVYATVGAIRDYLVKSGNRDSDVLKAMGVFK